MLKLLGTEFLGDAKYVVWERTTVLQMKILLLSETLDSIPGDQPVKYLRAPIVVTCKSFTFYILKVDLRPGPTPNRY
jgi:hypothetical protein